MEKNSHLGIHINVASLLIRRQLDTITAKYELSGIQGRILGLLYDAAARGEEMYQRDIEKKFGIRRSSVTSTITHMEQNGFIRRESVKNDARLKKLLLTEKGIEANQNIRNSIDLFEESLNNVFTKEEQLQLLSLLRTLIEFLESSDGHCPISETISHHGEPDSH